MGPNFFLKKTYKINKHTSHMVYKNNRISFTFICDRQHKKLWFYVNIDKKFIFKWWKTL